MEMGKSRTIFNSPKHPYTKALLASTPHFGMHYSEKKLSSIPGRVSDPAKPEPGCPFAPRCPFAKEQCKIPENECYVVSEDGEKPE